MGFGYRWVVWCTLGSFAVSCGGTEKQDSRPRYSDPKQIVASLDRKGAELLLGSDLHVRIPEGALHEPVEVKITRARPSELQADESDLRLVSDRVRFEPHGLRFERDVEIELRVQDDDVPDKALSMHRLDDEKDPTWEEVADVDVLQGEDPDKLRDLPAAERELRVSRRVQTRTRRFSLYAATDNPLSSPPPDAGTDMRDSSPDSAPDRDATMTMGQWTLDSYCKPRIDLQCDLLLRCELSSSSREECLEQRLGACERSRTARVTSVEAGWLDFDIEAYQECSESLADEVCSDTIFFDLNACTLDSLEGQSDIGEPCGLSLDCIDGYCDVGARSGRCTAITYVKASNAEAGDRFGTTVALSGDTLVVGAGDEDSGATGINGNQDDNSAENSGAAYVFVRDTDGTWTQQAYVKASNAEAGDRFGISVAISGDTLVVGARGEDSAATGVNGNQDDNSTSGSGAAYVFVRDTDGTWIQQAYLKTSDAEAESFGHSVAISGDTLVVGAPNPTTEDGTTFTSGAAYVFVRNNNTWTQQAYLNASNAGTVDEFGESVAISGDTLVVGADSEDSAATGVNGDQDDNSAENSGAAYVFVRDNNTWTQQAYLKASNTEAEDFFGESVAISGDTLVVIARFEDSNATGVNGNQDDNSASRSGAAYVFARSGSTWTQQAYIKAINADINAGIKVFKLNVMSAALSGDTLALGTDRFVRSGSTWTQQAYIDEFWRITGGGDAQHSVALSGDTLAVGTSDRSNATGINGNRDDTSAPGTGAVYVFH